MLRVSGGASRTERSAELQSPPGSQKSSSLQCTTLTPRLAVMNAAIRGGALVALVVLASSCADSGTPTQPTTTTGPTASPPAPPPLPPPAFDFPAVSRPARIYPFARALSYPVHEWTSGSRYVLYDDGTFALQYLYSQGGEYRGTYTEANGLVTLHWQLNQDVAVPWRPVTATLVADSLTVQYGVGMNMDDFEDAVYILKQSTGARQS